VKVLKVKFSNFIVIVVIILNVLFTAYMLYILPQLTFEPSTLIASWFAFTGTEVGLLALIKIFKVKGGKKNE